MRVRPISINGVVDEMVALLLDRAGRVRIAIDGAEALEPAAFADTLASRLRDHGRFAMRISTDDFLLPASQRFEFGRTNPESFYLGWRDERGLKREVLDPAGPDGNGHVLPALWRPDIDRSARADYVPVPADAVVIVSGQFLIGGALAFEMAVHLECSPAALARRTVPDRAWTLPAYAQYADEVAPASFADVVVRLEDPRHPAVIDDPFSDQP
jgi:hypothetical protein